MATSSSHRQSNISSDSQHRFGRTKVHHRFIHVAKDRTRQRSFGICSLPQRTSLVFLIGFVFLLSLRSLTNNTNLSRFWRLALLAAPSPLQQPLQEPQVQAAAEEPNPNAKSRSASLKERADSATIGAASKNLLLPPEGEDPHVFFNDLHYRRMCATVYHSVLCMILRFPFEVPLQDPTVSYPKPVPERMYKLKRYLFIEDADLEVCRNHQATSTPSTRINNNHSAAAFRHELQACMERFALRYPAKLIATFTRQRYSQGQNEDSHTQQPRQAEHEDWYGSISPPQRFRTNKFFQNHVIVFVGASPTTSVVRCIVDIFGDCEFHSRSGAYWVCRAPPTTATTTWTNHSIPAQHWPPTTSLHGNDIVLLPIRYEPPVHLPMRGNKTLEHRPRHIVNEMTPLIDALRLRELGKFSPKIDNHTGTSSPLRLRPLSVIVEYPIAHMQTQDMIYDFYDQVRYNQRRYPQLIMNLTTRAAQTELAAMGFELQHMIAFDGLPQHFPTETGGYTEKIHEYHSPQELLQNNGYPGWKPEYGAMCRGPLPLNSTLKAINNLSRQAFEELGLDMKFYGRIWEFANHFWWQEMMWRDYAFRILDCVHPWNARCGYTCIHKVFLQAMIDNYFEEEQQQDEAA